MPLILGTYLAGALLTFLVPITLLICFAVYFYRQVRRMPAECFGGGSCQHRGRSAGRSSAAIP